MHPAFSIEIGGADRAALETLVRGRDRTGLRARAVLALADGATVAEAARRVRVTEKTVRSAKPPSAPKRRPPGRTVDSVPDNPETLDPGCRRVGSAMAKCGRIVSATPCVPLG